MLQIIGPSIGQSGPGWIETGLLTQENWRPTTDRGNRLIPFTFRRTTGRPQCVRLLRRMYVVRINSY